MDSAHFDRFIIELRDRLGTDPRVLGLILLGSTADASIRDDFSDHDFWVIVDAPALPDYLGGTAWLPDAEHILLTVRHGVSHRTVVYRTRHKVEYAVFEPSGAKSGKIDRFLVLLDRGRMAELAAEIQTNTISQEADRSISVENFYVLAWSGWERARRGELLSARRYVEMGADVLLQLLARAQVIPTDILTDRLDCRRRLEQRAPNLAAALNHLLRLPPRAAIAELVHLAEHSLPRDLLASAAPCVTPIRTWLAGG